MLLFLQLSYIIWRQSRPADPKNELELYCEEGCCVFKKNNNNKDYGFAVKNGVDSTSATEFLCGGHQVALKCSQRVTDSDFSFSGCTNLPVPCSVGMPNVHRYWNLGLSTESYQACFFPEK